MLTQFGRVKRQCGNNRGRQDQWLLPRATQFEESPMAPVRIEAEADEFKALRIEKVDAGE
jgi:hypothetical protein